MLQCILQSRVLSLSCVVSHAGVPLMLRPARNASRQIVWVWVAF